MREERIQRDGIKAHLSLAHLGRAYPATSFCAKREYNLNTKSRKLELEDEIS